MQYVFNRTEYDVRTAREIIAAKVSNFLGLTEKEVGILNRGTITNDTLNRIEGGLLAVKRDTDALLYRSKIPDPVYWDNHNYFKRGDFERILDSLDRIKDSFFYYNTTPQTPSASYHYSNINDIERILFDFESILDEIKAQQAYCGDYICGSEE